MNIAGNNRYSIKLARKKGIVIQLVSLKDFWIYDAYAIEIPGPGGSGHGNLLKSKD
jgi:hypothetical protein